MQSNTDTAAVQMLSLKEVTVLLVKHFGYHEGFFELSFTLQLGVGPVGTSPDQRFPGAVVAITNVGLSKAENVGPSTVNAAEVNPAPKSPKAKPAKQAAAMKKPRRGSA